MRRAYQVTALLFAALAALVLLLVRDLAYYSSFIGPAAGFFPFWLGLLLAILSLIWLVEVSVRPVPPIEPGFIPERSGVRRIVAIVGALTVFAAVVDTVGFAVSAFAFLVFLLVVLGRQGLPVTLAVSVTGSFGLSYVFRDWLQVPLPASSLELLRGLGL